MSDQTERICPQCGAKQLGAAEKCWLCTGGLAGVAQGPATPDRFSFSLSTLMLIITLASVCLGLLAVEPGLGVFVCVILMPVFIRTAIVLRKREAQGMDVPPSAKISLFVASFFTALVVAMVVQGAAFGTFCLVCLTTYSAAGDRGELETYMIIVSFLVAGGVTLLIAWPLGIWIRRRYQRDTTRS